MRLIRKQRSSPLPSSPSSPPPPPSTSTSTSSSSTTANIGATVKTNSTLRLRKKKLEKNSNSTSRGMESKLFTPLALGAMQLKHRIILAPCTRNRGAPSTHPTPLGKPTWYPGELMVEYYAQRATEGGLVISDATPTSLTASGMLGVPGITTDEQKEGWKRVIAGVHAKGGVFVTQLWHQGRTTHSALTGVHPLSSSDVPISDSQYLWHGLAARDFEPPKAMTEEDMKSVMGEYKDAAVAAREAGADGVEIHAANGYLIDQFLHSNVNTRTDAYGGTPQNRCRFLLELVQEVGSAIGFDRLAVRLSPFGMFNQTRGKERLEQWTYLCEELDKFGLAYVHLIEPRFDEIRTEEDKLTELCSATTAPASKEDEPEFQTRKELTLQPFREALKNTKCVVAGGYKLSNCWEGIERGDHDAIAFGRYYISNPDLVEKLRQRKPLMKYDRSRFYGPFPDNEVGYTVLLDQEVADIDEEIQTIHSDGELNALRGLRYLEKKAIGAGHRCKMMSTNMVDWFGRRMNW